MNERRHNPFDLEWPRQETIPSLGEYLESIPPDYDVEQMCRAFPHLFGAMVNAIEAEVNFHGIQDYWLKRTDGVDVTTPLPRTFGSEEGAGEFQSRHFLRGAGPKFGKY